MDSVCVAQPLTLVLGNAGVPVRVEPKLGDAAPEAVAASALCDAGCVPVACIVTDADASNDAVASGALTLGANEGDWRGDFVTTLLGVNRVVADAEPEMESTADERALTDPGALRDARRVICAVADAAGDGDAESDSDALDDARDDAVDDTLARDAVARDDADANDAEPERVAILAVDVAETRADVDALAAALRTCVVVCAPDAKAAVVVDALADFMLVARADGDAGGETEPVTVTDGDVRADLLSDAASVARELLDTDAVTVVDASRELLVDGDAVKETVPTTEGVPAFTDAVEHADTGGDRETDAVREGDAVVRAEFDSDVRADADLLAGAVLLTLEQTDIDVVCDGDAVRPVDLVVDGDALPVFSLDSVFPV